MSRRVGITTICICVFTLTPMMLFAQAKRPMAINDLITAVRVSEPELSPDGRRVLFVRATTDFNTGKRNADIWSVAADGSTTPAPFITGERTENTPRFSPDGKKVLFLMRP